MDQSQLGPKSTHLISNPNPIFFHVDSSLTHIPFQLPNQDCFMRKQIFFSPKFRFVKYASFLDQCQIRSALHIIRKEACVKASIRKVHFMKYPTKFQYDTTNAYLIRFLLTWPTIVHNSMVGKSSPHLFNAKQYHDIRKESHKGLNHNHSS